MAMFLTAHELGRMLMQQDPDNRLPVKVLACDKDSPDKFLFAEGVLAPGDADVCIKHAQQTDAGDIDLVRLTLHIEHQ